MASFVPKIANELTAAYVGARWASWSGPPPKPPLEICHDAIEEMPLLKDYTSLETKQNIRGLLLNIITFFKVVPFNDILRDFHFQEVERVQYPIC